MTVKAVTESPKQDSHGVSLKLQCFCSAETTFFPCWIEHQEELAKKRRFLLASREEREIKFVQGCVNGRAGIALTPLLSFKSYWRLNGTSTVDLQRLKLFLRARKRAVLLLFDSGGTYSQHP